MSTRRANRSRRVAGDSGRELDGLASENVGRRTDGQSGLIGVRNDVNWRRRHRRARGRERVVARIRRRDGVRSRVKDRDVRQLNLILQAVVVVVIRRLSLQTVGVAVGVKRQRRDWVSGVEQLHRARGRARARSACDLNVKPNLGRILHAQAGGDRRQRRTEEVVIARHIALRQIAWNHGKRGAAILTDRYLHRCRQAGGEVFVARIARGYVVSSARQVVQNGGVGSAAQSGEGDRAVEGSGLRVIGVANHALGDDESHVASRRSAAGHGARQGHVRAEIEVGRGKTQRGARAVEMYAAPLAGKVRGVHRTQAGRHIVALRRSEPHLVRRRAGRTGCGKRCCRAELVGADRAADQVVPRRDVLERAIRGTDRRGVAGRGAGRVLSIRQCVIDVPRHALASTVRLVDQGLDAGHAGRGYGCAADDVGFADAAIRIDDASSFIAIHGAVMFGGRVQRNVRRVAVWNSRDQRSHVVHLPESGRRGRGGSTGRRCRECGGARRGTVPALPVLETCHGGAFGVEGRRVLVHTNRCDGAVVGAGYVVSQSDVHDRYRSVVLCR